MLRNCIRGYHLERGKKRGFLKYLSLPMGIMMVIITTGSEEMKLLKSKHEKV